MLTDIASTLIAAGVLGCLGYLRSISIKLGRIETANFSQDLHILDLDRRVGVVEDELRHRPRRASL